MLWSKIHLLKIKFSNYCIIFPDDCFYKGIKQKENQHEGTQKHTTDNYLQVFNIYKELSINIHSSISTWFMATVWASVERSLNEAELPFFL